LGPSINEETIVNRLKTMIPQQPVTEGPPQRGYAGQRLKREREHAARCHAVDMSQRLLEQGCSWDQTAEQLQVIPRTLRHWRLQRSRQQLRPVPLGRRIKALTAEQRQVVVGHIDEHGPGIALSSLRLEFPSLARAELEAILGRYRCDWQQANQQIVHVLHWTCPGAVWAMDFHGPRPLVDGLYPYLFAVRDLASGQTLAWQPVLHPNAEVVQRVLHSLILQHGAPLVIKADNGSAFIDRLTRALVGLFGARILFSPPRTPSYNGSIEAGIRWLTRRTNRHAGHADWTRTDVDAARFEANAAAARPKQPRGPSHDQLWNQRPAITLHERQLFLANVDRRLKAARCTKGQPTKDTDQRAMEREAISLALVELGYLYHTRRSIPLPFSLNKVANIT
jgi:transposase InsO family protein